MILNTNHSLSLPSQMRKKSQKGKAFKKNTMDALEAIGVSQIRGKERMLENYQMLKGKFIFKQYLESDEYDDLVNMLSEEFKVPTRLRHYDIISQVVNTLLGEMQKRPDIFTARCFDEDAKNRYVAEKSKLMWKYIQQKINDYIELSLAQEGLTLEGKEFESEEEQQAYMQQIESRRQELTPSQIEKFMATEYTEAAEIWANAVLTLDAERFNIKDKKIVEFLDMLATDSCFRHFYLSPNGYSQETWNPLNVFFHKSPEIENVEDGNYVGRIFYSSISEIINRYGYKMTRHQLEKLEKMRIKHDDASIDSNRYADTVIPYDGYIERKNATMVLGRDPLKPKDADSAVLNAIIDSDNYENTVGKFQVTEAYWLSQKLIGKYTYFDQELQVIRSIIVDEDFDTELYGVDERNVSFYEFSEDQKPNTIVWTWVNETWGGVKINPMDGEDELYLNVGPTDFQAKGDIDLYGSKLPVVGNVFSGRNGDSMSLVDLMKPHQIGYNVAMNQLYEIMQREKGRFMLMDVNMIPSDKDWGGPRNYERFMLIARELGLAPVDASPANAKNSSFSHFQVIDMDESARMVSRLRIAEAFENFALKQVGITPQRLGSIMASETATGVEQAVQTSYAQTETYFTKFFGFIKRCMQMNIDIAQYCAVNESDITLTYTNSDLSRGFIQITGTELLGKMIGLIVTDSQEVVRQLETLRALFTNNPNMGATPEDMAVAITSNSVAEIKTQLKASRIRQEKEAQAQRDHEQQLQQQQIEAAREAQELQIAKEDERLDKKLANDRYVAEIRAMGFSQDTDTNENNIPDVLEVQKFNHQMNKDSEDILFKRQQELNKQEIESKKAERENIKLSLESQKAGIQQKKLELDNKKADIDKVLKEKELKLKDKDIEAKKYIAKTNKNKYDK